ncbi:MAG: lysoplasmalogenase [Candidatus Hydrogenedentota bacterium]
MLVVFACIGVAVAGVGVVLGSEGHPSWALVSGISKMIASTAFLLLAWWVGAFATAWGTAIFAGLVLSWFGDLFLIFRAKPLFLAGLVSFFGGHVAYIAAFALYGLDTGVAVGTLIVLAALASHVILWLHPHLTEMRVPVYAYMVVISIMVAFSVGAWIYGRGAVPQEIPWQFPLGAGLFYVSDLFVARDRFVAPGPVNRYLGLPLYYAGQVILALGADSLATPLSPSIFGV